MDQLRRYHLTARRRNIHNAQPRSTHPDCLQPGRPRDQEIEGAKAHARSDNGPLCEIFANPAHALPGYRLDQRLDDGARLVDESGSTTQSQPFGMRSPASSQIADVSGSGEKEDAPTRSLARNAHPSAVATSYGGCALSGGRSALMQPSASPTGSSTTADGSSPRSRAASATSSGVSETGRRCAEIIAHGGPRIAWVGNRLAGCPAPTSALAMCQQLRSRGMDHAIVQLTRPKSQYRHAEGASVIWLTRRRSSPRGRCGSFAHSRFDQACSARVANKGALVRDKAELDVEPDRKVLIGKSGNDAVAT